MTKIFGDEFKREISNLKRLDKKILECKAQSMRIRHLCKTDKTLNDTAVTIEDAIRSLLMLSKNVNRLQDLINECEISYNKLDSDVINRLHKNESDVYNFKKIQRLRIGAENLSEIYSKSLKDFKEIFKDKRDG
tara:strand:+ start:295 stop:696 length:402 start_codon:yes stop_codon:yes gene_type:complete